MVYAEGGAIEASDYNNLVAQLNAIFGVGFGDFGYGGDSVNVPDIGDLDNISPGDELTNELWLKLRQAFEDTADHQGTILPDGLPSIADIEDGDIASFFPRLNSSNNIAALTDNRSSSAGLTAFTPFTDVRDNTPGINPFANYLVNSWQSFIQHVFTIKFVDSEHARFFFNTGGQIRISASRTGGTPTTQGLSWDSILIPENDFVFTSEDYFGLTGSPENLRAQISPGLGAYGVSGFAFASYSIGNAWTIQGQRVDAEGPNGGNGSEIKIYSNFLDNGTNDPDFIDGLFKSTITESKFTGVFDIDSPIFTTVTSLVSGN